jgi:hypothetical protein
MMTKQEVIDLMKTSKNTSEWNRNCDIVKERCGGDYPDFWFSTMIMSGLMNEILGPGSDEIKIITSW